MTDSSPNKGYDRKSYILMVDDDDTLLKFFKIHLNKFFSKVIVAKNGKEAVDILREKNIDLMICDINMPKIDGLQLIRKVHRHDSSIPCLLISGGVFDDQKTTEILEESDGYLRKPFSVDELHQFISIGMELRDHMSKLSGILNSTQKKKFRLIINDQENLAEYIKKEEQRNRAIEIIRHIAEESEKAKALQAS